MIRLIPLVALAASGGCWPMSNIEHELDLNIIRDSQPVSSAAVTGSAITPHTLALSRIINTTLGTCMFLLAVGTYWYLMTYTASLSNQIILPSKFLEDNISAILSLKWPKTHTWNPGEIRPGWTPGWVLFHKSKPGLASGVSAKHSPLVHQIRGFSDVPEKLGEFMTARSSMTDINIFSPVMKNLVQIAIWNSVSLWFVVVMCINTLVYNGFVSNNITQDSEIRLVLVSIYTIANIGFFCRTTTLVYQHFTFVLFQSCWMIISKEFVFENSLSYFYRRGQIYERHHDTDFSTKQSGGKESHVVWTSFSLELFGATERSDTYRPPLEPEDQVYLLGGEECPIENRSSLIMERKEIESTFDKFTKPLREAEMKSYEKAAESALEKILANIAVLLGICLSMGLAPWTSTQTSNATNTQLGSYALLLSISTGLLALVSGLTQMNAATDSARKLLLFQEKTIDAINSNGHERTGVSKNFSMQETPGFSFSNGIVGMSELTWLRLWSSMSFLGKLRCFIFGPALTLVPHFHRNSKEYRRHPYPKIFPRVQDTLFGFEISKLFYGRLSRPICCNAQGLKSSSKQPVKHVNWSKKLNSFPAMVLMKIASL